ncbi:MAG: response regulator [Pyrinomonadaceae bacterium]
MRIDNLEEADLLNIPSEMSEELFESNVSTKHSALLDSGIKAAKSGDRATARRLLLELTEKEPESKSGWLWLASISEYPEELLIFLNKVLKIDPENERATKWLAETTTLLSKNFVQQGIDSENDGNAKHARQCFLQAIVNDENNELAWLKLAETSENDHEKLTNLKRVVTINPENTEAKSLLEETQKCVFDSTLAIASDALNSGDKAHAQTLVEDLLEENPCDSGALLLKAEMTEDIGERIAIVKSVLDDDPQNEAAIDALDAAKLERILGLLQHAKDSAEAGDEGAALSLLDEILIESPGIVDAWLLKAEIVQNPLEKMEAFRAITEMDPENELAHEGYKSAINMRVSELLEMAESALDKEENDEAAELANQILTLQPESEAGKLLTICLFADNDKKEQALNEFITNFPDNEKAKTLQKQLQENRFQSLAEKTKAAIKEKDAETARNCINQLRELDQDRVEILLFEAAIEKDFAEKRKLLEAASELAPENVDVKAALAAIDHDEAEHLFSKASKHAATGEKDAANEILERVHQLNPALTAAWMLSAHLSDSFSTKIECFEKVLEIEPQNDAALANMQSLKAIIEASELDDFPESSDSKAPQEPIQETSVNAVNNDVAQTTEKSLTESNFEVVGDAEMHEIVQEHPEDENFVSADLEEASQYPELLDEPTPVPEPASDFAFYFPTAVEGFEIETQVDEEIRKAVLVEKPQEELEEDATLEGISDVLASEPVNNSFDELEDLDDYEDSDSSEEPIRSATTPFVEAEPEEVAPIESTEPADSDEFLPVASTHHITAELPQFEDIFEKQSHENEQDEPSESDSVHEFSADEDAPSEPEIERIDDEGFSLVHEQTTLQSETAETHDDEHFEEHLDDDVLINVNHNSSYFAPEEIGVRTIMIVDDSPMIRRLISGKLQKVGHRTLTASDGIEAVELLKEVIPDLVLLDITMPKMDGYQVCKHIRENESTKDIPVILVSGKDGFFDKARGKMAGSTNFISKPFGPDALMKMINEHLQ